MQGCLLPQELADAKTMKGDISDELDNGEFECARGSGTAKKTTGGNQGEKNRAGVKTGIVKDSTHTSSHGTSNPLQSPV